MSNHPPGDMDPDWWEQNMHTAQELRHDRSGLKSHPGAFEEGVSRMERRAAEAAWRDPAAVAERAAAEERRLKAQKDERDRIANDGRPKSRRMADGFAPVPLSVIVRNARGGDA